MNHQPSKTVPGLTDAEDASIELNAVVIQLVRDLLMEKPGAIASGIAFLAAVDAASA